MIDNKVVIFTYPKEDQDYHKMIKSVSIALPYIYIYSNTNYYGPKSVKGGYAIKIKGFSYSDL